MRQSSWHRNRTSRCSLLFDRERLCRWPRKFMQYFITSLKMGAIQSSGMMVMTYKTVWHQSPKESNHQEIPCFYRSQSHQPVLRCITRHWPEPTPRSPNYHTPFPKIDFHTAVRNTLASELVLWSSHQSQPNHPNYLTCCLVFCYFISEDQISLPLSMLTLFKIVRHNM
jgi:hypothetical protein